MISLKNKKIVLVTHILVTGAPTDLKKYLLLKVNNFLFIGHPFSTAKDRRSFLEFYKNHKILKQRRIKDYFLPEVVRYFKDFFLTIYWIIRCPLKFDLYIGADNLNALAGIVLRRLKKVKKVIYYTIDYSPRRFQNPLLNKIYHWIERYCACNADLVWNISPKVQHGRIKYGLNPKKAAKFIVVPQGIWFNEIPRKKFTDINKHQLVFLGHLLKKQGVDYIIKAIPNIKKEIKNFHFLIIGTGPDENRLYRLVKKFKVAKTITFTRYIKDHSKIDTMLAQSAISVALYHKEKENFTYYADPGKIKCYLAAGLPIIITDVPFNAKDIEKNKCGIVVDCDIRQISEAIIKLMKNNKMLNQYRKNAIKYAKQFDWNKIFTKALLNS